MSKDYSFDDNVRFLCERLGIGDRVTEKSLEICGEIREVDGFRHSFTAYGGFDAVVAVSVYMGAYQCREPVEASSVLSEVYTCDRFSVSDFFAPGKLRSCAKKFRKSLGLEQVVMSSSDWLSVYLDRVDYSDGVNQAVLRDVTGVSQTAIRYTYKMIVEELTGVDTSKQKLTGVDVTPVSFGFYGDSVEAFAESIVKSVEDKTDLGGSSPKAVAAAVVYIAVKVFE